MLEMGGGDGSAGERTQAPGFFVGRDSLASSVFFTDRRDPKTSSPQQPERPAAGRPPPPTSRPPGCAGTCPPSRRATTPAHRWVPLPLGPAWGSHLPGPPGSPSPLPPAAGLHQPEPRPPIPRALCEAAALLRLRAFRSASRPQSAPLSGAQLGEEPRRKGQSARSQSFCKWHLELATSQRIFT